MFPDKPMQEMEKNIKIEKYVVLAEHLDQQADYTRCRRKMSNQGKVIRVIRRPRIFKNSTEKVLSISLKL